MSIYISLKQLQIFEAVAKAESYTRAAERLHMTQPAISMQVKQLENLTDLALFERHGKRIKLTISGKEMFKYSTEITGRYQDMLKAIVEIKDAHIGRIKVSAATTTNHFITQFLAHFSRQKAYQKIDVCLEITNRKTLIKQLSNYEPDLAIMGEPPKKIELVSKKLMPNPLVVIASPYHSLVRKKKISLKKIAKEKFIVREQGSGTKDRVDKFFNSHGLTFNHSFEMGSNEAIKHAVEAGLGLGIVSLHTIKLELETNHVVMLDVQGFPLMREWHLVKRKGKRLTAAAKAFQDFMLENAEEYINTYKHLL